jgi:hypothetical protein
MVDLKVVQKGLMMAVGKAVQRVWKREFLLVVVKVEPMV